MNAYELADEFRNRDWDEVDCVLWCEKSANALRQQADRIAELEKELKENEEFAKAWILYATKIEMLMPTMWDSDSAREMGWSVEYLKGYNDAIREARAILKKASEK